LLIITNNSSATEYTFSAEDFSGFSIHRPLLANPIAINCLLLHLKKCLSLIRYFILYLPGVPARGELFNSVFNSVYLYSPFPQIINLSQCFTICTHRHPHPKTSHQIRKNTSHWLHCPGNTLSHSAHWLSRLSVGGLVYPLDVITPATICPLTCGASHEWGLFQGLPRGPSVHGGGGASLAASDLFLVTQRFILRVCYSNPLPKNPQTFLTLVLPSGQCLMSVFFRESTNKHKVPHT